MTEPSEAASVYLRLKALFGAQPRRARRAQPEPGESAPFGVGRDPRPLEQVIGSLTEELGWQDRLEEAAVLENWAELVGEATAERSRPVALAEGVLTVACDSTAWAAQLRLLRSELVSRIAERYPRAGVETIRFLGPDVPTWKKGPRSVPGRGPRDTYG